MHPDQTERCPRRATEGIAENAGERLGTILVAADEDRTQARCARCGHPIVAPRSVATGYGPVCRHLVDRDELHAAGMSTRAIAPVVGVDNKTVWNDLSRVESSTPAPAVNRETGEILDELEAVGHE